MRKCMKQFADLILSRDSCIYVRTYEENEFIRDVATILTGHSEFSTYKENEKEHTYTGENLTIYVYSRFEGLYTIDPNNPDQFELRNYNRDIKNTNQLLKFIQKNSNDAQNLNNEYGFDDILSEQTNTKKEEESSQQTQEKMTLFILKDMHMFFDKDTIRAFRDLKEQIQERSYCPIIVTSPVVDIPCELEKLFTLFEYENMTKEDIKSILYEVAMECEYSEEEIDTICDAATGLTYREMLRALMHSVAEKGYVDPAIIHQEKIQVVKKSGALDYIAPVQTLEDTGGYVSLKTWIREMKAALTPEAKAFGVAQPKGAMLVGLPGNGKTVTAEMVANYLEIPLLQLDLAKIMGSFVGQSERAISNALRIVKACAPCVLLIDEAEKLFGGYQSSANTDSGTLSRVLAQLLQFLQEDNGAITIMTSNNVFELPPELTRSGRLDAQWYFGFPNAEERREILNIYLKKNNLDITENIFNYIIRETKNYSGAEIKEIVKNILIKSYFRQKEEGKTPERTATVEDVRNAIAAIVPIYQSSKEKIDMFTEMAKGRYRNASAEKGAA